MNSSSGRWRFHSSSRNSASEPSSPSGGTPRMRTASRSEIAVSSKLARRSADLALAEDALARHRAAPAPRRRP